MTILEEIAEETVVMLDNARHQFNVALASEGDHTAACLEYFNHIEMALIMAKQSMTDRIRSH